VTLPEVSDVTLQGEVLCVKLVYLDTERPYKVAAVPAVAVPLGGKFLLSCPILQQIRNPCINPRKWYTSKCIMNCSLVRRLTWELFLYCRRKHKLWTVFENRMLRVRTRKEQERGEKCVIGSCHELCASPCIITVIKHRRMEWEVWGT